MTHTYHITGMTCGGCAAKVKSALLKLPAVSAAEVQLTAPQATISMQRHIATSDLQAAVSQAGNYQLTEADEGMHAIHANDDQRSQWQIYKPLFLVFAYILGITLSVQFVQGGFNGTQWMRHFMAGFFLVFSFFKLINLKGFAESYSTYDIIAQKWQGWGFVYAFIELILGVAFLINFNPLFTNAATFVVMSLSIIGVLQSVLNHRKIKCACLGDVFNLPMSTITIIEDGVMIAMSGLMVINLISN